jgi:3-deoxy-D-manno-octulosonate 8-phosphate phosphatase (KDO 8-P phosphatase)
LLFPTPHQLTNLPALFLMKLLPHDIDARVRRLRLLLFDVDGVLTDGRILMHGDGSESKQFHIRDGTGLVWARRVGLLTGVLSARSSLATTERARQLGVPIVLQGVDDKLAAYRDLLIQHEIADDQVAFMGDDVMDLPVLGRVGLACAPADAVPEVRERVHWVSEAAGGAGAVRELIDLVLRVQGHWPGLLGSYLPEEVR